MNEINFPDTMGIPTATCHALDAIQWHEGMLLLPQHFQQADLRYQYLLDYHLHRISPYHWGVGAYSIDPVLLAGGVFRLLSYEVLFPDGLLSVSLSGQEPYPEVDLTQFENELTDAPLLIQLRVSTSYEDRFNSVEGPQAQDNNTGDNPVAIPRLQPRVVLSCGPQVPVNTIGVPLAYVEKYSNAYRLTPYIPPHLSVQPETPLHKIAFSVAAEIRTKIAYLCNRLQSQSGAGVSSESEFILRALNAAIVPYEAQLYSQGSHPFVLYMALCTLAGHVAAIYARHIPPLFHPYDHNNLLVSYKQVVDYVQQTLGRIQEGYEVIQFNREDRLFKLEIEKHAQRSHLVVGALVPEGMTEEETREWIKGCIIATEGFAAQARDRRILGCSRQFVQGNTEMGLLPTHGVIMFSIENDSRMIDPAQELHVFNISDRDDKRPTELVLYVPKH